MAFHQDLPSAKLSIRSNLSAEIRFRLTISKWIILNVNTMSIFLVLFQAKYTYLRNAGLTLIICCRQRILENIRRNRNRWHIRLINITNARPARRQLSIYYFIFSEHTYCCIRTKGSYSATGIIWNITLLQ